MTLFVRGSGRADLEVCACKKILPRDPRRSKRIRGPRRGGSGARPDRSFDVAALAQSTAKKILPNPYRLVEGWPTLLQSMNGGKWGELIRVTIDRKGDIWVFHRCFNNVP